MQVRAILTPEHKEEPHFLSIDLEARLLVQIDREGVVRDVLVLGVLYAHRQVHEVIHQRRHREHSSNSPKERPHLIVLGLIVQIHWIPKSIHFPEHFCQCHWHFYYQ